jgi:hypothetical protein
MHISLVVICSDCKLRCHADCVDDEGGVITCNLCEKKL